MRFILGVLVGVGLTVGGAYLFDTQQIAASDPSLARPMVNWESVSKNWHEFTAFARNQWTKIAG